jgi:hypothetical protein
MRQPSNFDLAQPLLTARWRGTQGRRGRLEVTHKHLGIELVAQVGDANSSLGRRLSILSSAHYTPLRPRRARNPDAGERNERYQDEEAIKAKEESGWKPRHIWPRRRRAGEEFAPDRGSEAKGAEQHQHTTCNEDHTLRHDLAEGGFGPNTGCECDKPGAHPSSVGAFGGEDSAIGGKDCAAIRRSSRYSR